MIIVKKWITEFPNLSVSLLVSIFLSQTITAQTAKQHVRFTSIFEAGLIIGDKGEALALQTINGIKKNKWFAGVGAGFDFYGQRTIPLFLNYRHGILANRNTPFIYVTGGANFAWIGTNQKTQLDIAGSTPGYYYDLGAGWRLSGKKGHGFLVSAGYTLKQVKYKTPYYTIFAPPQPGEELYNHYNYLFRRLVVKIGFQF